MQKWRAPQIVTIEEQALAGGGEHVLFVRTEQKAVTDDHR